MQRLGLNLGYLLDYEGVDIRLRVLKGLKEIENFQASRRKIWGEHT